MERGILADERPDVEILKDGLSFDSDVEDALAGRIEEHFGEIQSYVVRPVSHRNVVGQGFGKAF